MAQPPASAWPAVPLAAALAAGLAASLAAPLAATLAATLAAAVASALATTLAAIFNGALHTTPAVLLCTRSSSSVGHPVQH